MDTSIVLARVIGLVSVVSTTAFAARVTSNLPPTPPNFVRIVELNEAGDFPTGDPTELESGANRCAVR